MYKVLLQKAAHDSLREIVSYVGSDALAAEERLFPELQWGAIRQRVCLWLSAKRS